MTTFNRYTWYKNKSAENSNEADIIHEKEQ